MTLSNAVTSSRIVLSPLFFVAFFLPRWFDLSEVVSLVILWILFALIEASDLADGAIARRLSQTSDTGKLLDPFADSLSRLTYFLCFTMADIMPVWIFLILLYRDLGVGFIRLMILRRGVTLSARLSGKLKAWIYAFAGIAGLVDFTARVAGFGATSSSVIGAATSGCFYAAGAIAIWSFFDYLSFLLKSRGITPHSDSDT